MGGLQQLSLEKPQELERDIFLTLFCNKCKTFRRFKITESLKNLLVRNSKSIRYIFQCNSCGTEIGSNISWGNEI
jgi:RNase P subunit RPR2